MKSIKPGRGPSKMGAVSSACVALFGVFWCIFAASMGGWFMVPFGLVFVGMAIYGAIYNYRNATSKDRYSIIDIVDSEEESDPLNEIYGRQSQAGFYDEPNSKPGTSVTYCPYCGRPAEGDFDFCPGCGRKLPD
jgi:hypothetical protein